MLSRWQVKEFHACGYLKLPGCFGMAKMLEMRAAFERLEARARALSRTQSLEGTLFVIERRPDRPLKIERIVWCGGAEPPLARFGRDPRLLEAMAQLLGAAVLDQLINQAHIKHPGDGVQFAWHQDSYHRRYGSELFDDVNGCGSFVQALTAVDSMGPENGGLYILPGSHRKGHIPTSDGRLPVGSYDPADAIPVCLAPGDTLLLSPFTIHGSAPNVGRTPRRVFINGFCCPNANRREYPGAGVGLRVRVFASEHALLDAFDEVV